MARAVYKLFALF